MSRLTELLAQARAADPQLGKDLTDEFAAITKRRTFGLVFEKHEPEAVELPGRAVRRGDKVRVLPARSESPEKKGVDRRLWAVARFEHTEDRRLAHLVEIGTDDPDTATVRVDDLVVIAEFRDRIYPGLVETGRVENAGPEEPFHSVINAENYHALEMLTYTHRHSIDCIYIDPPYNTGAKDWKYNNDYVASDDDYRHSKWLSFMERRLKIAKELLNPEDSVLIVTIDEKEYLRLGMLLEQTFSEARIQVISSIISRSAAKRSSSFSRTDEYIYFVMIGDAKPSPTSLGTHWGDSQIVKQTGARHMSLRRTGSNNLRQDRPGCFYPIFLRETPKGTIFDSVGAPFTGTNRDNIAAPPGTVAVWPLLTNGEEGRWQVGPEGARRLIEDGFVRITTWKGEYTFRYYASGEQKKTKDGTYKVSGRRMDGSMIIDAEGYDHLSVPGTQWNVPSHDASTFGTKVNNSLMPDRRFPYPKSLYAVEDAIRFFVSDKLDATVLDFFSGSGTTAHAVMRLNKQDGGRRRSISVTNNEVSADEQKDLRRNGHRPGDPEWEALGICDYITKPRITAAIIGNTPAGDPIRGDYKFTDEFPMSEGFAANAAFFTLTYEDPRTVRHNRAFSHVAPILWMRAGSLGRIITNLGDRGWDLAEGYGVCEDMDRLRGFCDAVSEAKTVKTVFIVTDSSPAFQLACRLLPERVSATRLYESYLHNFEINRRNVS